MTDELKVIPGYETYSITPDGQVFNNKRNTWIKPYKNKSGYYSYHIYNKHMYVHRLVAITYLDKPIDTSYEVDHIDENKGNNHYSNLQWVSHRDNLKLSFKRGNRASWWKGKSRPSPVLETRIKMSNAKKQPIIVYLGDELIGKFDSINATAKHFNVTRITIYNGMQRPKFFRGYTIKKL